MKQILSSLSLALLTTLSHAASLHVYQDTAIYTYSPKSNYVGIAEGVLATCKGQPLPLEQRAECNNGERLCSEFNDLQNAQEQLESIQNNITLLDKIIELYQPTTLDAKMTIDAAKKISAERAKLVTTHQRAKIEFDLQKQAFYKQTSATLPLYYSQTCDVPTKLKFSNSAINFRTFYEADLSSENMVKVTQYLAVTNHSGVDIVVDDATFYYRMSQRTVHPVYFHPWIISKYQPPLPRSKSLLMKSAKMMDSAPAEMMSDALGAPAVEYVDAREYKVAHLELPSTGEPVKAEVNTWSAVMKCGLHTAPYANLNVYEQCSFTPQTQIETHSWEIKKGEELISSRAFGEYRENTYSVYTKIDEDIKVSRKPIVRKEKDTGFFGNTVRKKDGYILTLTNKSDKDKTITVTERIPTSETEEIEVKLLQINSDKKVDYNLLKDGKVEINVLLHAGEERTIEILFEIAYDKEMEITY
ncbi:DUF4139 domain-containing protein [Sulfurovum sp. zt1-1]|uniref:DUF4139 domain-containing protein n=1 Tax=Sulfurovum zhangzhouensis TaxID=3019067 RepID=A0ABT7QY43_9BACT|nr:DUF4139 domain-containing protein [Sulfurovum zhangzhouensis]MDM5271717.1 DUF4139 domain-containing protein [Sulfurovum zhangzhouensis]